MPAAATATIRGASPAASVLGSASPRATAGAPASGPASGPVVDVVGKVRRPGVYRLAPGARVDDAVRAAGGLTAPVDPASINLARKIADGEQIAVGIAGRDGSSVTGAGSAAVPGDPGSADGAPAPSTAGSQVAGSSGSSGAPIDLNLAGETQLDALPGVGPVLAQRILEWRTAHGRFASVDQLGSVPGIGPTTLARLRPLVSVS
jgi:competence protein ComEA